MTLAPIHSGRLTLRSLAPDDLDAVFSILSHRPTVAQVSFGLADRSAAEGYLDRRIETEQRLGVSMWAVHSQDNGEEMLGLCGFFETDDPGTVELGYVVHADHWGQGIASEAVAACLSAAHDAGFGVMATIRSTNVRSLAVAERTEMRRTGTIDDARGTLIVWRLDAAPMPTATPATAAVSATEERLEGG